MICCLFVCAMLAQDDPVHQSSAVAARAIARAMLGHDLAIESLEWSQEIRFLAPDATEADDNDPQWVLFREGRYGEDEKGNWYWWGSSGLKVTPGSHELTYFMARMTSSAEETVNWVVERNEIGIAWPTEEMRYVPTPFMALGRWIDVRGTRRLGEMLLASDSLVVHDVAAEEGLVALRAHLVIDAVPSVVLVTIDTRHGFAPRSIVCFNEAFNHVSEDFRVNEYVEVDGVWIPSAGSRTLYSRIAPPSEMKERFDQRVEEIALAASLDGDDHRVLAQASREVFGNSGWPVQPLADGELRFKVTAVHSLNEGFDEQFSIFRVPPDAHVFNHKTGMNTYEHPREQVLTPDTSDLLAPAGNGQPDSALGERKE